MLHPSGGGGRVRTAGLLAAPAALTLAGLCSRCLARGRAVWGRT